MIELRVNRLSFTEIACEGEMLLDGEHICWTIEDRSRGLTSDMPLREIWRQKVYGETAIPTGRYRIEFYNSPRHGPDTLQLVDVPSFSYIQIHAANTSSELLGCIAPGLDRTTLDDNWVGRSRAALAALREKIVPRMKAGEECWITITEPESVVA